MELETEAKKEPAESIIPMINVVFLLLIFFLMSATLTPPDPLEAEPPEAASVEDPAEAASTLVISKTGEIGFKDLRGDEAIAAAAAAYLEMQAQDQTTPMFQLRADAGAPATFLASTVAALAQAGVKEVALVAVAAGG